jgi:protein-tyrosine phosphatase
MRDRDIDIEGMVNVRDLGGLRTRTGQVTKHGVIVRGDAPHRISNRSRQQMIDRGLQTVIDMRYAHELAQRPNRFAGHPQVDFKHIPLYVETSYMGMIRQIRDLGGWYCTIIDQGGVPIRTILRTLAHAPGTTLLHCYIGKDRTGILTALLLQLVGVSDEDIVDDYAQSHQNVQAINDEIQSVRPFFVPKAQFENLIAAKHEYINTLLTHLATTYTDAAGYMQSIGVTNEEVAAIRAKLIDSAGD